MNIFLKLRKKLGKTKFGLDFMETLYNIRHLKELQQDEYIQNYLFGNPRYSDSKRLNIYEKKVYSQNGEDGILEEIFHRIGEGNRFFVEFGVGNGLENNSTYLLIKDWKGVWIEGSSERCDSIRETFKGVLSGGQLKLSHSFITRENIVDLFKSQNVPIEPDLLSIDIDGNDYWVWKQLKDYRARVIVIEYNAAFPPHISWVKKYNPKSMWDGTTNHGASLKSMTDLGKEHGYTLVACDFSGANAFFVRDDLVGDNFPTDNTSEFHYERSKSFLDRRAGHPRGFTEFEKI